MDILSYEIGLAAASLGAKVDSEVVHSALPEVQLILVPGESTISEIVHIKKLRSSTGVYFKVGYGQKTNTVVVYVEKIQHELLDPAGIQRQVKETLNRLEGSVTIPVDVFQTLLDQKE